MDELDWLMKIVEMATSEEVQTFVKYAWRTRQAWVLFKKWKEWRKSRQSKQDFENEKKEEPSTDG